MERCEKCGSEFESEDIWCFDGECPHCGHQMWEETTPEVAGDE